MRRDVTFSLPAEAVKNAESVVVLGSFNNWTPGSEYQLAKQADGSASVTIPLEEGETYQYRFLINGERWENDYHAERYEPVEGYSVENSVITVPKADAEQKPKSAPKARKAGSKLANAAANEEVPAKAKKKSASKKEKSKPAAGKTADGQEEKKAEPTKTVSARGSKGTKSKTVEKTGDAVKDADVLAGKTKAVKAPAKSKTGGEPATKGAGKKAKKKE